MIDVVKVGDKSFWPPVEGPYDKSAVSVTISLFLIATIILARSTKTQRCNNIGEESPEHGPTITVERCDLDSIVVKLQDCEPWYIFRECQLLTVCCRVFLRDLDPVRPLCSCRRLATSTLSSPSPAWCFRQITCNVSNCYRQISCTNGTSSSPIFCSRTMWLTNLLANSWFQGWE